MDKGDAMSDMEKCPWCGADYRPNPRGLVDCYKCGSNKEGLWFRSSICYESQIAAQGERIGKLEAVARAALDVHHGYVNGNALGDLMTILGKAITIVGEGES